MHNSLIISAILWDHWLSTSYKVQNCLLTINELGIL